MYSVNLELISSREIISFTLPRLHKGKQWYVDFFAHDPSSGRLRRKKYMLDRYKRNRDREDVASMLISNLTEKLKAGWNPFVNASRTRQFTEFSLVLKRYRDFIVKSAANGSLKKKTFDDYSSRLRCLEAYLDETGTVVKYAYQFNTALCIDFLDYLIYDKEHSAKTRNNYRTWLSTLGTWMKDRLYIDDNPVESIRQLRESEKFRDALTPSALLKLKEYLSVNNPYFYQACMVEYYCFIRPGELRYVTIGDISIEEQSIYIRPEISKNRKGQRVAVNDSLMRMMISLKIFNYPSHYYLFSDNFMPGEHLIYINAFRLEWTKVRKALHWPDSYQFYSLKDSGIRDLANAEGIVTARDQARHSDVAVTNHYLKQGSNVHEETKHFKGEL